MVPETNHYVLIYNHFMKNNPNVDKLEAIERLLTYSRKKENNELFFTGMPTFSPSFKESNLLQMFSVSEPADYLAKTPIEEQQAKVKKLLERMKAVGAKTAANKAAQLEEYERENRETMEIPFDKDPAEDVTQLLTFWTERQHF